MKFKTSYIWAGLVALGVIGWMVSGSFTGSDDADTASVSDGAGQGMSAPAGDTQISPNETANAAPRVSAVIVENAQIRQSIRASGITEPAAVFTISAEIGGTITEVAAREGSAVEKGDVLVVMDTQTLPSRIAAAKAEMAAAKAALTTARNLSGGTYEEERAAALANLEVATQRLEIGEKLVAKSFSAPVDLAQLKANFETARMTLARIDLEKNYRAELDISQNEARFEGAKSSLVVLQDQLAKSRITAPIAGWLETVHVDVGEQMPSGAAAATILNMEELSIIVAVPQTNIAQVAIGNPVSIDVAGVGQRTGKVSRIASISTSTTRTFDVEITVPNPDRMLRAGMTVEADIDVGYQPAFGMSPAHLLVTSDGSLTAKVDDDGVVRVVPVELVRSGVEQVFVSGLANGDRLLTFGQAFVEAGDMVRVLMEPTS
jgi:multidrug efflux system membrane fusion protein